MSASIDLLNACATGIATFFDVHPLFAWLLMWLAPGVPGIVIYYLFGEWDNISYHWNNWFIGAFREKGGHGRFWATLHSYFFEDERLHVFRDTYQPVRWWWFTGGPILFACSIVVVFQEMCLQWKIAKMKQERQFGFATRRPTPDPLDEIAPEIRCVL